jgi:hypothetical protein
MVVTSKHALITAVANFVTAQTQIGALPDHVLDMLIEAKKAFELAPDESIDIGRLPPNITDFETLVTYLKTIKDRIGNRPSGVKNEDWELAKSGELKIYKLFVCCIHAVNSYVNNVSNFDGTKRLDDVTTDVINNAPTAAPEGLSENGRKLWAATFSGAVPRTRAVMKTLIYLLHERGQRPAVLSPPTDEDADKNNA